MLISASPICNKFVFESDFNTRKYEGHVTK